MSRGISSALRTATEAGTVYPFLLCEINFAGGVQYIWSGAGNLSWDSKTWQGVGDYGSISTVSESANLDAGGVRHSLSGVAAANLVNVLSDDFQGRDITDYFGCLDAAIDGNIIVDPIVIWKGKMDVGYIDEGAEASIVTITSESDFYTINRPRSRRMTDGDQQSVHSGDKFFEFTESVAEGPIATGNPGVSGPGTGSGGVYGGYLWEEYFSQGQNPML